MRTSKRLLQFMGLAVLGPVLSVQTALAQSGGYPDDPASVATGLEIAEIHCAACHAVGRDDLSAVDGAPAFRDLSRLYPLYTLEESLAEGIVTGHEGMPEIAFEPDDIASFLGYLTSIQSE
ncbi:cytochrome c family protein [Roseibium aquae]|uniref:Cytochrome c family protein n=1 Tax=Roseibium aquae TaxID=1323746 RepID=A0A916X362_9HYPH|nr:cytochrome c [Roseibium aquae]GGB59296.1 cytochrome c family protein [Roseibium aquae]